MTLDEIEALRAPEQRLPETSFEAYTHLCVRAGVTDGISKAAYESLPLMEGADEGDNLAKASAEEDEPPSEKFDLKKDDGEEEMGDDDDEDTGEETETAEADEEEGEEDYEMDKADIEVTDLMKAIDAYAAVEDAVGGDDGDNREVFLSARLDAGMISKSERAELGRIWAEVEAAGIEEPEPEDIHKSLVDTIEEDDDASQLVDASDFLRTLVKGVDGRMGQVVTEVSRDGRATRELLKAQGSLIKSLATHATHQDEIIKSMAARLAEVESAPVPRRAITARPEEVNGRGLTKSVGGGTPDRDDNLSKAQVTDALRALMIHAVDSDDGAAVTRLSHATALYEQTGDLPTNVMAAIQQVS
jgi:hypothetical protein